MKLFLMLAVFFVSKICFSQGADTVNCSCQNSQVIKNIHGYIRGKNGKANIARKFFRKKFEIKLSDPSFEIIKFYVTWDDRRKGNLYSRVNFGARVIPDLKDADTAKKESYSLKKIIPGSMLTFDCFVIKKEQTCYTIPAFVVYVTL